MEAARAAAADAAARLGAGPRRDVGAQAPQDAGAASSDHGPKPTSQGAPASPRRDIGALLKEMEALRARLQARLWPKKSVQKSMRLSVKFAAASFFAISCVCYVHAWRCRRNMRAPPPPRPPPPQPARPSS